MGPVGTPPPPRPPRFQAEGNREDVRVRRPTDAMDHIASGYAAEGRFPPPRTSAGRYGATGVRPPNDRSVLNGQARAAKHEALADDMYALPLRSMPVASTLPSPLDVATARGVGDVSPGVPLDFEPSSDLFEFGRSWGLEHATLQWLASFPPEVQSSVMERFKPDLWPQERIIGGDAAELAAAEASVHATVANTGPELNNVRTTNRPSCIQAEYAESPPPMLPPMPPSLDRQRPERFARGASPQPEEQEPEDADDAEAQKEEYSRTLATMIDGIASAISLSRPTDMPPPALPNPLETMPIYPDEPGFVQLRRAVAVLEYQMLCNPSAIEQLDEGTISSLLDLIIVVVDLAAITEEEKTRLVTLVHAGRGTSEANGNLHVQTSASAADAPATDLYTGVRPATSALTSVSSFAPGTEPDAATIAAASAAAQKAVSASSPAASLRAGSRPALPPQARARSPQGQPTRGSRHVKAPTSPGQVPPKSPMDKPRTPKMHSRGSSSAAPTKPGLVTVAAPGVPSLNMVHGPGGAAPSASSSAACTSSRLPSQQATVRGSTPPNTAASHLVLSQELPVVQQNAFSRQSSPQTPGKMPGIRSNGGISVTAPGNSHAAYSSKSRSGSTGILQPDNVQLWIDAAEDFELSSDFDVTQRVEKRPNIDLPAIMAAMKEESNGKRTIQALSDKLMLHRMIRNLGIPQMPVLIAVDRQLTKNDVDTLVFKHMGGARSVEVVLKPSHLSNGTGVVTVSTPKPQERQPTVDYLVQHVQKFLAEKADPKESAALRALRPGFLAQPKYKSVISFKLPLELRVLVLWGRARLSFWWWGRGVPESSRNAWFTRRSGNGGRLDLATDVWECVHEHTMGTNRGFEKAIELFQRHLRETAAAAEALAVAVGAPFLRADFFVGSTEWGVRLNEVAYGCGADYRNLVCEASGERKIIDDAPQIARILREGMSRCRRRAPPERFLSRLGVHGTNYNDLVVSDLPASLRPQLPEGVLREGSGSQCEAFAVPEDQCISPRTSPPLASSFGLQGAIGAAVVAAGARPKVILSRGRAKPSAPAGQQVILNGANMPSYSQQVISRAVPASKTPDQYSHVPVMVADNRLRRPTMNSPQSSCIASAFIAAHIQSQVRQAPVYIA